MMRTVRGKYFGTEINEKWWRRYRKNKMFARGNGTFSYDEQTISFLRLLTRTPLVINFEQVVDIKLGKWHAGQWGAGQSIIKIVWKSENLLLSSGFSVSGDVAELDSILKELNSLRTSRT